MMLQKVHASMFRSRVRFANEGEKCTKYFFNLEKRNYFCKNIRSLHTESGNVITEQNKILKEQRNFYKELYSKDERVNFTLQPIQDEVLLNEEQITQLAAPITLPELHTALLGMKDGKCPGLDGLPKEFYACFFDKLGPLLHDLYVSCFHLGELNPSARRGLISLIPKKGKNMKILKSWRPLTLLELDFKILSKTLAERMKRVLPSLICDEQVGFMAGRRASHLITLRLVGKVTSRL